MPACESCGVGFPVRNSTDPFATCSCGSEYQACPKCQDGWLVERKGRYRKFLGCVKFPRCSGKAKYE
ncbi:topoisomerase DNA-binding C4 zinc finger domain-containing protein [Ruegeria sp. HKCCA5426]|uniref:topoisomerase DNA-binding C4 zinc finger domain-containing protein n=1 Tax=Ruegeria sp. HKCCA5426 TaxID=2682985 RepID=UPI001487B4B5|nr:topoisomerase DNA-binding C4 zinc finger domain-containing protein [Ruegeria sp. HKCCA5426]